MSADEELREKLDAWLRQLAEYGDRINNFPEGEIRTRVVNKLLDRLGWDTSDDSMVKYEVPVTMGRETKKADYVLISNNNKCCVVETKAGSLTLDDEDARQSISYALFLKCPWAIVTNGRKLCLYDVASFKDNNPMNSLVMELEFLSDKQEQSNVLNYLQLLAKGNLDLEEGKRKLNELRTHQHIHKFIENNKEQILNDIIPDWVQREKPEWTNRNLVRNSVREVFSESHTLISTAQAPKVNTGLTDTAAGDWEHRPNLGRGIFAYKNDTTKTIDVSCSGPKVKEQLEKMGLKCSSFSAFGGFYNNLRQTAKLAKKKQQ